MSVAGVTVRFLKPAPGSRGAVPNIPTLVAAWLSDDPDAWAELFDLFDRPLRRYLLRVGNRPEDVHDLAGKVWDRARRSLRSYDPSHPFLNWLLGIARNVCLELWHARKRHNEHPLPEEGAPVPDRMTRPGPATPLLGRFSAADLHLALSRLSAEEAAVCFGHYGLGYGYAELGRQYHRKETTLRSISHRAMARLRLELDHIRPKPYATKPAAQANN